MPGNENMTVKIMTIHCIPNFGSVYQAAALQKHLGDGGHPSEIVDYRPPYFHSRGNTLKARLWSLIHADAERRRTRKYEQFISTNMVLTRDRYRDIRGLRALAARPGIFMTGGDQLWNSYYEAGRDPAYRLAFSDRGAKMAFGTSMGRETFEKEEIRNLAAAVRDYEFIGLRERSSVEFLRSEGLKNVEHVTDPVLLLDRAHYESRAVLPAVDNYAFVYSVNAGRLLDEIVERISREGNLKIVYAYGFRKRCRCDLFIKDAGPEEILGLLLGASLVVSASYHATLFSILFQKPFVSMLPHIHTNARILELLEFADMKDRIVASRNDLDRVMEPVSYRGTEARLEEFIAASKSMLKRALEMAENRCGKRE